jgi:hypothetical protein
MLHGRLDLWTSPRTNRAGSYGRVRVMLRRSFRCRVRRSAGLGVPARFAAIAAAAMIAPVALGATGHPFTASYAGHGSGGVVGTRASGSATLTGRGTIIGRGTLTGSASGVFISRTCVAFSGKAVLKGRLGSIELAAHRGEACAGSADANEVSFSGTAQISGGSAAFAGARGTLSFTGTYIRQSGAVTISLRGRITY